MQNIKPQKRSSNPDFPAATGDDVDAARQRVQIAMDKVVRLLGDLGATKDLAVMFQSDPLSAEFAFRDLLF